VVFGADEPPQAASTNEKSRAGFTKGI